MNKSRRKEPMLRWGLKKFLKWPPAWAGVGIALLIFNGMGGLGGGMAGPPLFFKLIFSGMWGFGISVFLSAGYKALLNWREAETEQDVEARALIDEGRKAQYQLLKDGRNQEAEILQRFLDLKDAIQKEARKESLSPETASKTVSLAEEVCTSVQREIESSVVRRKPLDGKTLGRTYAALEQSYVTLRDLDSSDEGRARSLDKLAEELEEENKFAERLRDRLEQEDLLSQFDSSAGHADDKEWGVGLRDEPGRE